MDEEKYLRHFWLSRQNLLEDANISSRQKADELRNLLFTIHGQLTSGKITINTYRTLHKKISTQYSSVVDSMDKRFGLNNYNEMIADLIAEKRNDSNSWTSSLSLSGHQPLCFKQLLSTCEQVKDGNSSMRINLSKRTQKQHNSQVPLNGQRASCNQINTTVSIDEMKTKPHASQTQENIAQENFNHQKYRPLFGKRKVSQAENETYFPGGKFSLPKSKHCSEYMNPPSQQHVDSFTRPPLLNTIQQPPYSKKFQNNGVDKEEEEKRNPFLTAREQLIVDQKKYGRNSTTKENISSANYKSTGKKSLGTRRGVSSKFIPPVNNQDRNESDGKKAYSNSNAKDNSSLDPKYENFEWMKNVDPKMVELIENEIMEQGPGIQWDDIAGLEFAKKTIQEIVIWPMLRPDIFTGLRGPPKGLLLFGPPGTGKTLIGKCIASQSNATFFSISASSLTSKWVGEGEKMVRALFGVARCHQPAVIFIDEIDSLLTQRSDTEHESSRRIKTEFLVQLDGATSSSEDRLLVVGATNRPQELDEAARRRLVKRLYIPLPEIAARKQIIMNLMSKQSNNLSDEDLNDITAKSNGFSGADMANLCREAALGPIRTIQDIRSVDANDVRPVLHEDFQTALKFVRPSVSQNDLQVYKDWNSQYGSGSEIGM